MENSGSFRVASEAGDYATAAKLFKEYAADIGIDLAFQGFEGELTALQKQYGPPAGALILGYVDGTAAACVGVRRLEDGVAELKRMYVQPAFRGHGLGAGLLERALKATRELGYRKIRLDTLATMLSARALYRRFGFYEIPAYRYNPHDDAVYMEAILSYMEPPSGQ
ncbi:MAG TPA: GNAT family N-acetyltransferase [Dinghuibacter sp.]|uniref:GNAT family N-acetyltransferase n=1 Tax=Dinghuibacter sp. TaxID=2024697 RepID=UPI002BEF1215|nr:GNAT family N-acetyltransferase [Dinghuibacter sp.]HTJ11794.1 GNAT family N-acetyltransferase [Dinghuibacter sp.]